MMKQITFSERTVNPVELTLHPYLIEAGFDFRPDAVLLRMLNETGLYERSIVTPNNEVLTQSADLRAALENGVSEVQVYEVSLTPLQLKLFVMLKHKYCQKDLLASYKTAAFLRDWMKEEDEIEWLAGIDGDFNVKIASLMGTSDSTVKRLLRVGDKAYDKLGLIQHGETSFKEVLDKLKLTGLNEKSVEKKKSAEPTSQPDPKPSAATLQEKKNDDVSPGTDVPGSDNEQSAPSSEKAPVQLDTQTSTGAYSFTAGLMTFAGLGDLDVSVTSGEPTIKVNNKEVKDAEYIEFLGEPNDEGNRTDSYVIRQKRRDGFSIQITIENYPKAA